MRYICSICGYVYDEAENVPWTALPEDWKCPLCGAAKADFAPEGGAPAAADGRAVSPEQMDMKPLNAVETAVLLTSLAKGCDKQYLPDQASAFRKLAAWFEARGEGAPDPSFGQLADMIGADLNGSFPAADAVSRAKGDRGALRSLAWSEKVTRILRTLLERYAREGDAMLENTGVYVCTICGFVYVGNDLPPVCPVCRVPNRKFEKIGG